MAKHAANSWAQSAFLSCALACVSACVSACGSASKVGPARPLPCAGSDCQGPGYPRIASYRIESSFDEAAEDMLRRVQMAIIDVEAHALNPQVLPGVKQDNPALDLLAYLTSEEIPRDPQVDEQPLAAKRFAAIPPLFWLTEPGSELTADISADATLIPVADASAFTVQRPESDFYPEDEPTYLLLGAEHVRLVRVSEDGLVVERAFNSQASAHPAGTRVAGHVVFFAGTWMLNIAATAPADAKLGRFRDMLAEEAAALVDEGPWTGVFLDVCFSEVGFLNGGRLDVDRDGKVDDPREASRQWTRGFGLLVDALRERLGPQAPLLANPGAQDCPHEALDGILLEGWPLGLPEDFLSFDTGLARYRSWSTRPGRRALSVANAFSPKIGFGVIQPGQDELARRDYAAMRAGLSVALMGDGYSAYDNGVFGHYVAWWYDEYDGAGRGMGWLGQPTAAAMRHPSGAWSRPFQHGMAVANPTARALKVSVPPGYRKLAGKQDPSHNDGAAVHRELVIAPQDGYVLTRE